MYWGMREYAQICLRKDGKSERRKVRFLCLCFNKIYDLKEHEAVFLKRQNLFFSIVGGSISFVFLFWTKYFYNQDFKFAITFGG